MSHSSSEHKLFPTNDTLNKRNQ